MAPLPARKQLWEAGNAFEWKAECEKSPEVFFGLAANGELVNLDESAQYRTDAVLAHRSLLGSTARWEEWCSGMDEFGGLIMLTASLIG